MTDINNPDKGREYTPHETPPAILIAKHARIIPLQIVRTALHGSLFNIQAPRNRPPARSKKKMEMLYTAIHFAGPWYPASSVGIQT